MSKKNLGIIVVAVLVILVGVLWAKKVNKNSTYSMVYLITGEVYVGKLQTFPILRLRDGYVLQLAKDATDPAKSSFQLNPLAEALWAPEFININRKNVVFYGPLMADSEIAETLTAQLK